MSYLGRIPSPYDGRDWKLEDFIEADPVAAAVAELKLTTVGYRNKFWSTPPPGTHWANALALLTQQPTPSSVVKWADSEPILDQGAYGTCVGNGFAQFGNTLPIDDKYTETDARAIYYEATVLDGNPDNPDAPGGGQQGATVRSGAKAMQNRKRINNYAFASTIDAVRAWVKTKGPVVFGTNWLTDMDTPDASGLVHATGDVRGGHCYLCFGDDGDGWFRNSWGAGWGVSGEFKMSWADAASLLANGGEAVTAVEV